MFEPGLNNTISQSNDNPFIPKRTMLLVGFDKLFLAAHD